MAQYDCTVPPSPLLKERFTLHLSLPEEVQNISSRQEHMYCGCTVATADKPLVRRADALALLRENVTIADMESACIAYVCQHNRIPCLVAWGRSDFTLTDNSSGHAVQTGHYLENTPIVMLRLVELLPRLVHVMAQ